MRCASTCARTCAAGCWYIPIVTHAISCTCTYACCFSASRGAAEVLFGFVCFACITTPDFADADLQSNAAPSCGSDETNSTASAVHSQPLQHQQPALHSHNDNGSRMVLDQQQQPPSTSSSDASGIPSDASGIPSHASGIPPCASGIPPDAHQQPNSASQQHAEEACSDHQHASELQPTHLSSIHQQPQRRQQQWQHLQSQQPVDAQPSGQPQASSHSQQQQQQPDSQYRPNSRTRTRQMSAEPSNQGGRPVAVFASAVTGAGLQELLLELERKVCC